MGQTDSVILQLELPQSLIDEWSKILKESDVAKVAEHIIENGYRLPDFRITKL